MCRDKNIFIHFDSSKKCASSQIKRVINGRVLILNMAKKNKVLIVDPAGKDLGNALGADILSVIGASRRKS